MSDVLNMPPQPANVTLEGMYASFEELDLENADAWLYTSEWDGVPSMLLEVSMTGVPIVGSLAGGTGEILQDEYTHPIAGDAPEDYCKALRAVVENPDEHRQKALKLREHLLQTRTPARYLESVTRLLEGKNVGS